MGILQKTSRFCLLVLVGQIPGNGYFAFASTASQASAIVTLQMREAAEELPQPQVFWRRTDGDFPKYVLW
jgi:hypothetical protein